MSASIYVYWRCINCCSLPDVLCVFVPPFYILFISIFCPFVVATCVECAAHFIRTLCHSALHFLSSFGMQFKILHKRTSDESFFCFPLLFLCIFHSPLTWPLSWVIAINYYCKFITTNGAELGKQYAGDSSRWIGKYIKSKRDIYQLCSFKTY